MSSDFNAFDHDGYNAFIHGGYNARGGGGGFANVWKLDAAGGNTLWTFDTGGGVARGVSIGADGYIYVAGDPANGKNLWKLDSATGGVVSSYNVGGLSSTAAATADSAGNIYVGFVSGQPLRKIDKDGNAAWATGATIGVLDLCLSLPYVIVSRSGVSPAAYDAGNGVLIHDYNSNLNGMLSNGQCDAKHGNVALVIYVPPPLNPYDALGYTLPPPGTLASSIGAGDVSQFIFGAAQPSSGSMVASANYFLTSAFNLARANGNALPSWYFGAPVFGRVDCDGSRIYVIGSSSIAKGLAAVSDHGTSASLDWRQLQAAQLLDVCCETGAVYCCGEQAAT